MTKELAVQMIKVALQILESIDVSPEKKGVVRKYKRKKSSRFKKMSSGNRWTPEEDKLVTIGMNRIKGRTKCAIFTRRSDLKTGRNRI